MNEDIGLLQVPSEISKVETMRNGALKLRIDTQENLSPEVRTKIMSMSDKLGWLTFSVRVITPEDIIDLPEIKNDSSSKTPSQRLRSVIYVLYNQEGKPGDFEQYYTTKMNKIIDWIKEKIN